MSDDPVDMTNDITTAMEMLFAVRRLAAASVKVEAAHEAKRIADEHLNAATDAHDQARRELRDVIRRQGGAL